MAFLNLFGARVFFNGDEAGCKAHMENVKIMAAQLQQHAGFQNVPIYRLDQRFPDGTVIKGVIVNGERQIIVTKPMVQKRNVLDVKAEFTVDLVVFAGIVSPVYCWDIQAIKPSGEIRWEKTDPWDSGQYTLTYAWSVDIDDEGNIYTAGQYYNDYDWSLSNMWAVDRRSRNGERRWIQLHNLGSSVDIAVDDDGIYICGSNNPELFSNATRYERRKKSDGSLVWSYVYEVPGAEFNSGYSIAVDSKYVYVSNETYSFSDHSRGRLLTIDKSDGSILNVYQTDSYGDGYSYKMAIAVKDPKVSKPENVVIMSPAFLRTLDGSINVPLNYVGSNTAASNETGIKADNKGIYTVGIIKWTSPNPNNGYEVCKWDWNGNKVWSKIYATKQGVDTIGTGPYASDLAIDNNNIYIVGHYHGQSYNYSLGQCLNKDNGNINWTSIANTTSYWYGVAAKNDIKIIGTDVKTSLSD